MERKKVAKAAELEEDALIVEYLRQRQLKEQVIPPSHNTQIPPFNCKLCPADTPLP